MKRPSNSARMGIAIALSVLFGLALITANHAAWLTASVLDEERFVSTFAPLPQDEAVALALAQQTADAVMESFEVTETIAETLPDGLEFIAVPLAEGVRGLTTTAVAEIIRSDAFTTVWTAALTGAHRIATVYVGAFDEDGILAEESGVAVLDFTEIGDEISEALDGRGFGLIEVSDRDLKVELFVLPDSGMIKFVADLMTSIRWAVIAAMFVLLIAAFGVATDRRRIAIWVGGAAVVAMSVSIIEFRYAKTAFTGDIGDSVQKAGAEAAWDIVFRQFVWQSWVVLLLGILMIFVAWAMRDSSRVTSVFRRDQTSPVLVFVGAHRALVEVGAAVLVGGFLLAGPQVPIWAVLVAIALLGMTVAGVEYVASSEGSE